MTAHGAKRKTAIGLKEAFESGYFTRNCLTSATSKAANPSDNVLHPCSRPSDVTGRNYAHLLGVGEARPSTSSLNKIGTNETVWTPPFTASLP